MANDIEVINPDFFKKYFVKPTLENISRIKEITNNISFGKRPVVRIHKFYGSLDGINLVQLDELVNEDSREIILAYNLAEIDVNVQYFNHEVEPRFIKIEKLYCDNPGQLYLPSDFLDNRDKGVNRERIDGLIRLIDFENGVLPYLLVAEQPDGRHIVDDNRLEIFYAFVLSEKKELPCIVMEKDLTPAYIRKQQKNELKLN